MKGWQIVILYDLTPEEERRFSDTNPDMTPEEYFYQEFGEATWSDPAEEPDPVPYGVIW